MTKENQKIEEVKVLTPTLTEEEYAHCISVDECIERLHQRVHQHYHPDEWTKEEEREAFLYTSKVNASRLMLPVRNMLKAKPSRAERLKKCSNFLIVYDIYG